MELTTKQAAAFYGVDPATIRNRINKGQLTSRIVSGQGPAGRVKLVEVPEAKPDDLPRLLGKPAPTTTKVPGGYVSLREASELTGMRTGALTAKCVRGVFPSAQKVMIGRQEKWYIARADLGLTAETAAPQLVAGVDDLLATVGPALSQILTTVFRAGEAIGIEKAKAAVVGLTNGKTQSD